MEQRCSFHGLSTNIDRQSWLHFRVDPFAQRGATRADKRQNETQMASIWAVDPEFSLWYAKMS
jgi:hypothetical protein